MTLLVMGLVIFFAVHFVPASAIKSQLLERFGEAKYKGIFSLIAALGLGLIIYGFSIAPFEPLFNPMPGARHLAMTVMPLSLLLVIAADFPNNFKSYVKHPMLLGVLLWSLVHLLANGDLATSLIFVCFGLYALISLIRKFLSAEELKFKKVAKPFDIALILVGLAVYGLIVYFHGTLFGVPII